MHESGCGDSTSSKFIVVDGQGHYSGPTQGLQTFNQVGNFDSVAQGASDDEASKFVTTLQSCKYQHLKTVCYIWLQCDRSFPRIQDTASDPRTWFTSVYLPQSPCAVWALQDTAKATSEFRFGRLPWPAPLAAATAAACPPDRKSVV